MPSVSAPPGLSSTITVPPSAGPSSAARMRATVSVALPAACGTISRIGWSGYSANAATGHAHSTQADSSARNKPIFIPILPLTFAATLFDHFVGSYQHRLRYRQSKSLRGLDVDDKIKTHGLFDWNRADSLTLQNLIDIVCRPSIDDRQIRSVGNETAGFGEVPVNRDHGQRMACCEIKDLPPVLGDRSVIHDEERFRLELGGLFESARIIVRIVHRKPDKRQPQ